MALPLRAEANRPAVAIYCAKPQGRVLRSWTVALQTRDRWSRSERTKTARANLQRRARRAVVFS